MMSAVFLEPEEIAVLTGRKMKSLQIDLLRRRGLRFWINATGHPVVPRSAVDGITDTVKPPKKQWQPPE
jgi:hypothetical protein